MKNHSDSFAFSLSLFCEAQKTLYRSYQEAKVALQMGRFSGKESKLAFFGELGPLRLFYNQREQDLRDYFNEILDRF